MAFQSPYPRQPWYILLTTASGHPAHSPHQLYDNCRLYAGAARKQTSVMAVTLVRRSKVITGITCCVWSTWLLVTAICCKSISAVMGLLVRRQTTYQWRLDTGSRGGQQPLPGYPPHFSLSKNLSPKSTNLGLEIPQFGKKFWGKIEMLDNQR